MKTKIIHTALFSFILAFAHAQSIPSFVIASAGTYSTWAGGSMTWTLGEMMIETYPSGNYIFTQGFNQPDTNISTGVINMAVENISIYPNPVVEYLTVNLAGVSGNHVIYLYNMLGQVLLTEKVPAGKQQVEIPFLAFANGVYLLSIVNTDSSMKSSFKIDKTD